MSGKVSGLSVTQSTLESDNPAWDPWIHFFLQSMQKQKANLLTKLSRERILEGELPALSLRILELVRDHERVKTSDIETHTGEGRSTIKLRLNDLVQRGMLARHGNGPSTWYSLSRE
jgi:predicted HTH transcriptional regulator